MVVDAIAALAVTALLAESYGVARRRFRAPDWWSDWLPDRGGDRGPDRGPDWSPAVLGVLFGFMALVQMHNSMQPFDGLILDFRNIPIALAGAFLGWRGLVPCLVIALAARIDLGGVGMAAGIWSMVIAGLAGMIWSRKMAHLDRRSFGALVLLGLGMSAHLLGGLALPRDMAIWFFTVAAGPMLLMNLFAVPLIAYLFERDSQDSARTNHADAASTRDPDSGLLKPAAFVRDLTDAYAAQPFGTFAGFVAITPHRGAVHGVLSRLRGRAPLVDVQQLGRHLDHAGLACLAADGTILVPLSDFEMANSNRITHDLRQSCRPPTATPFDLAIIAAPDLFSFLRIAETAERRDTPRWCESPVCQEWSPLRPGETSFIRRSRILSDEHHAGLFAKADFLINRSHG